MNRIFSQGVVWTDSLSDVIHPRYFSAVGVSDTLVYIYGGVGNEKGAQEYGIQIFNDLYVMDLCDYSVQWRLRDWCFYPTDGRRMPFFFDRWGAQTGSQCDSDDR